MNGLLFQTQDILILLCGPIQKCYYLNINNMDLNFFIGYDAKEDIAYRVCKYSLLKRASINVKVTSLKLDELISKKEWNEDGSVKE